MRIFLAALLLLLAQTLRAQESPTQPIPVIVRHEGRITAAEGASRRQFVSINPRLVEALQGAATAAQVDSRVRTPIPIRFNLFEAGGRQADFVGQVDDLLNRTPETRVARGRLTDTPEGLFTIVLHGGLFSLQLFTPGGDYRIYPDAAGRYTLEEEARQTPFRELLVPARDPRPLRLLGQSAAAAVEDGSRIDVLIAYTTATKQYWGGSAQVELGARQMEEFLNRALINSLPDLSPPPQVRFVAIEEFPNSVGSSLNSLTFSTAAAPIRRRREELRADLVILVGRQGTYAGQAWVYCGSPNFSRARAYGVVRADYLVRIKTVAHEIGHLFGANHDPANTGAGSCWHRDSRGHNFNARDAQGVRRFYGTIMSYPGAANRISHFSNPAVSFLGVPTGTATRNNARAIRESHAAIANFYASEAPPSGVGPEVRDIVPANGAQLPGNTRITVTARITDDEGVARAELLWDQTSGVLRCPGGNQVDWSCTLAGDTYTWLLDVGTGTRTFRIRATDSRGNVTTSPTRSIQLTRP